MYVSVRPDKRLFAVQHASESVDAISRISHMDSISSLQNYESSSINGEIMACVFPHSTDYDESDKLYFEELTLERVLDIYELVSPERHALPYSAVLW